MQVSKSQANCQWTMLKSVTRYRQCILKQAVNKVIQISHLHIKHVTLPEQLLCSPTSDGPDVATGRILSTALHLRAEGCDVPQGLCFPHLVLQRFPQHTF